jgi:hypothetical protein
MCTYEINETNTFTSAQLNQFIASLNRCVYKGYVIKWAHDSYIIACYTHLIIDERLYQHFTTLEAAKRAIDNAL